MAPTDMPHATFRPPVSTRHAFALAFDLAVRRDPLHSLVLPFALRAPWIVALALLAPEDETSLPFLIGLLWMTALFGDFLVSLAVGAMLRFRARSVFNTAAGTQPEAAGACYGRGLQRLPWLFVTEALRNALLGFGIAVAAAPAAMVGSVAHDAGGLLQAAGLLLFAGVLLLPVAWIGYRLALATEAVVLGSPNTLEAFRASYRLTAGRFERWLEMLVVSVLLGLCAAFVAAFLSVAVTGPPIGFWLAAAHLLVVAVTPVIQYAWTFFYLRLAELNDPGIEAGPVYARADAGGPSEPGEDASGADRGYAGSSAPESGAPPGDVASMAPGPGADGARV